MVALSLVIELSITDDQVAKSVIEYHSNRGNATANSLKSDQNGILAGRLTNLSPAPCASDRCQHRKYCIEFFAMNPVEYYVWLEGQGRNYLNDCDGIPPSTDTQGK